MTQYSEVADLTEQAELQAWQGNASAAAQLYELAAEKCWEYTQTVQPSFPQRLAVYGVQSLSLYQRAGNTAQALTVGRFLLAQPNLRPCDHETVQRILRSG